MTIVILVLADALRAATPGWLMGGEGDARCDPIY
jgi:hypothetical protein